MRRIEGDDGTSLASQLELKYEILFADRAVLLRRVCTPCGNVSPSSWAFSMSYVPYDCSLYIALVAQVHWLGPFNVSGVRERQVSVQCT